MYSTFFSVLAATLVAYTTATPIASNSTDGLNKRDLNPNIGVFICSENDWQGDCFDFQLPFGVCFELASLERDQAGWNNPALGSIGPDVPASQGFCSIFDTPNCVGTFEGNPGNSATDISNPGVGSPDPYWVFNTHSIRCSYRVFG